MRILIFKKIKASKHSHLCVYFFVWTLSKHLKFLWWSQICGPVRCGGRVEVAVSSRVMHRSEGRAARHSGRGQNRWWYSPPKKTSLRWHYFPPAQKQWGHPFLRDWNVREYLAWTHPVLPAEDTQTRVRERGGEKGRAERRAGSGHSDYGFQFWQLKAPQGFLCTRTCDRFQKIQMTKALFCKEQNCAAFKVWLQWNQNHKKANLICLLLFSFFFYLKSV